MRALRVLAWCSGGLLLTLALGLGLLVFVLSTESGTRRSLDLLQQMLPALEISAVSGDWLNGVALGELRYRDESVALTLTSIHTRLNGAALFTGQLRLPVLAADRLEIELRAGDEDDSPLLPLPTVAMPVPLIIGEATLGTLQISKDNDLMLTLNQLGTGLQWLGSRLRYVDAHARLDQWQAQATGTLQLKEAYALALNGRIAGSDLPQALHINTEGDLQQLRIGFWSGGPWPLRGSGWVRLLDDALPLDVRIELIQPVTLALAGEPLTLHSGVLLASGDLGRLDGELSVELEQPRYGRSRLQMPLQWRPQRLTATPRLILPSGSAAAACDLQFRNSFPLRCDGTIDALPLTPWLSGIEGELSGPIQLALQLRDSLQVQLALPAIDGMLAGRPLQGELALASADGGLWQLQQLVLRAAGNSLSASGQLSAGSDNRLELTLQADALAELSPQLTGDMALQATLSGSWKAPSLQASFRSQGLGYTGIQMQSVTGELNINRLGLENSGLLLKLDGLAIAGVQGVSATLRADGTRAGHRLRLDATQATQENTLRLRCDGTLERALSQWQLRCPGFDGDLAIDGRPLPWQLQRPLQLAWQRQPNQLTLQPFCLLAQSAELCLDQPLRWRDGNLQPLTAHAHRLPLRWALPWLPRGLRPENDAVANLDLSLSGKQPLRLQATLDASGSSWRWRSDGRRQRQTLERLQVSLNATKREARLQAEIAAADLGRITAGLRIDDPREGRKLEGELLITGLQMRRLQWLLEGAELIGGQVDGRIGLGGSIRTPTLDGLLTLRDGVIHSAMLGEEPVREIALELRFDQQQARFDGRFALGSGGGTLSGSSQWLANDWQLQAQLDGSGLVFAPLPDSEMVLAPELTLEAGPTQLRLAGEVLVERAAIRIEELPPETISVSADTEVIGREQPTDPVRQVALDVRFDLGKAFNFQGFGADVDLAGNLRIRQEPGQLLRSSGRVRVLRGRYRAYGQRLIVREGTLFFSGPIDNPELNLEAIREMRPTIDQTEVEVGLRVTGSLQNPEARLFSRPGMPESDIAYYLLTGTAPPEDGATGGFSAGGTLLSLGLMRGENQAAKLAERFGISDLQIGTAETARGSEAEVGGYLTPRLYVRYGAGLDDQGNSITFQYRLTPRLLVEAISGADDALDLLYTFTID